MSKDPLHVYLAAERSKGVTHFTLSVHPPRYPGDSEVRFYIHPAHVSGETNDYSISEHPFNPREEFIFNLAEIPEPDVSKLLEMLRRETRTRDEPGLPRY